MVSFSFIIMMLVVAVLFTQVMTPYFMVIGLILQTIFMSLYLNSVKILPWFSYILFLVFLGGVLVLFTYVSSLLSEEIMEKLPLFVTGVSSCILWSSLSVLYLLVGSEVSGESWGMEKSLMPHVKELFSLENSFMYLFVVLYLLLALICVVGMMKSKQGPLRLMS